MRVPAWSGEGCLLGHRLFFVSSCGRIDKGALSWVSLIGVLSPEPSWYDHLPEASPFNTIAFGGQFSPCAFWRETLRPEQPGVIRLKPPYSVPSHQNSLLCAFRPVSFQLCSFAKFPHLKAFVTAVPSTENIFQLFTTCLEPFCSSWIRFSVISSEKNFFHNLVWLSMVYPPANYFLIYHADHHIYYNL